jgi:hypothetical protein
MNKNKRATKAINLIKSYLYDMEEVAKADDREGSENIRNDINILKDTIRLLAEFQNNGWIPVSEKLPDETGHYLITNKGRRIEYIWFKATEKKWYFYNSDTEHINVIAWQPLPDPYKEVSE